MIALVLLAMFAAIALIPVSLVMRYRTGTMRRPSRRWVSTLNVVMLTVSALFFLTVAAMTNVWVPRAFVYAMAGLGTGAVLGVIGLVLTRWETTGRTMHFTPNRWLVLVTDDGHCRSRDVRLLAQLARVACAGRGDLVAGGFRGRGVAGCRSGRHRVLPDVLDRRASPDDRARGEKAVGLLTQQ